MEKQETVCGFSFESDDAREQARKEEKMIRSLSEKTDFSDAKTALKLYNKLVTDQYFETVVGYSFLMDLRGRILKSGLVDAGMLADIPVKEEKKPEPMVMSVRASDSDRFQRMYEGQKLLNKKLKIAVVALVVLVVGFVIVNFKFEYSIFTFFTNYKATMEEEIIDKYEEWQTELEQREQALEKKGG